MAVLQQIYGLQSIKLIVELERLLECMFSQSVKVHLIHVSMSLKECVNGEEVD
jgi:hypothetical protein